MGVRCPQIQGKRLGKLYDQENPWLVLPLYASNSRWETNQLPREKECYERPEDYEKRTGKEWPSEQIKGGASREGNGELSESDLQRKTRVSLQRVETRYSLALPRANSE